MDDCYCNVEILIDLVLKILETSMKILEMKMNDAYLVEMMEVKVCEVFVRSKIGKFSLFFLTNRSKFLFQRTLASELFERGVVLVSSIEPVVLLNPFS